MYARVAVASTALDLGDLQLPVANALHGALIESLLAHGRLVFTSNDEALQFVRAVKETEGIPPDARTRWQALLTQLRQTGRVVVTDQPGTASLADVGAVDVLRAGWSRQADIAVVATASCASLGVPEDTGVLSDPNLNPDIAIAVAAPQTPTMARINQLQEHPIATHGSAREDFWRDVLEPLATNAGTVTVLDPYLFTRLSDIAHGRVRRTNVAEHVTWLLEHLDSVAAGGATVRLMGNAANVAQGDDAAAIATFIHDQWAPQKVGRLARVEVLLGQQVGGRRFPHDRHIRFSTGSAIKVPAGLDRLRETNIWDSSGMWWSYLWQRDALNDLRADERAAESLARHADAFALFR